MAYCVGMTRRKEMTPCEEKGYEVGQVFEVGAGILNRNVDAGDKVVLHEDDGTSNPAWWVIEGKKSDDYHYGSINGVKRIYPPEELSKYVTVTCEGKDTVISRESAEAMNLL